MSENTPSNEILLYLKTEKLSEIKNTDISKLKKLLKTIKDDIISNLKITEDDWKKSSQYVSAYIKAINTIHFASSEYPDVFNKLSNCNNIAEVSTLISDNLPKEFSSSQSICKVILRELKAQKNDAEQTNSNKSKSPENDATNNFPTKNKTLDVDMLESLIKNNSSIDKKIHDSTDEEIGTLIKNEFKDNYSIPSEVIDEYINSNPMSNTIKVNETQEIEKVNLINKQHTDELNNIKKELNESNLKILTLESEKENLISELEDCHKEIEKYKKKSDSKNMEHMLSIQLKNLNTLLNSNSSERQITIKNDILVKISKYIDKYNLIKTEDLIASNRDLHSEIVQIILLAFIYENSLL